MATVFNQVNTVYIIWSILLASDILYNCSHTEIARINELRAMADMLQKQLEGSMHGPTSGSALGPRPSPSSGRGGSRESDSGGSVVLVSNLSEKVFLIYCISVFDV